MHQRDHERFFDAWTVGDPVPPAELARLEACEECSARRRRTSAVRAVLDREAALAASTLAEAARERDAPGVGRVDPVLRAAILADDTASRATTRRSRAWIIGLVAAGVLACAAVWIAWRIDRGGRGDVFLGEDSIDLVEPVGAVHGYSQFAWKGGFAGSFEVVVRVRDASGATPRELLRRTVRASPLVLSPIETSAWPDAIEWEVRAFDGTGRLVASRAASASRSP